MGNSARLLAYFGAGSAITGLVFGAGFALNLGRGVRRKDIQRIEGLTGAKAFHVNPSISGSLLLHPDHPRATIVCVHGRSANRMEMFPFAERMFREGFNVALWDMEGRTVLYDERGIRNILSVVEKVRHDPFVDRDCVVVAGFSLGAAMAIGAAAHDQEGHISAVVADSPYANLRRSALHYVTAFGHIPSFVAWPTAFVMCFVAEELHGICFSSCNPSEWAHDVRCPIFLIHGRDDWRIPPKDSETIFSQLRSRKELWLANDAGHTEAFHKHTTEYIQRMRRFLDINVRNSLRKT